MKITYEIERAKNTQFIWRRKHGNNWIHSTGHEQFKNLQGPLRAILRDCGFNKNREHHIKNMTRIHADIASFKDYMVTSPLGNVYIKFP